MKKIFENVPEQDTITEVVYRRIKDAILSNRIKRDEKIIESVVAKEMNISKTPVREALLKLEHENLVKVLPQRGTIVISPSKQDIIELYEVREALEILALKTVIPNINENEKLKRKLNRMLEQCGDLLDKNNASKYLTRVVDFHTAIVKASNNKLLTEIYSRLSEKIRLVFLWDVNYPERMRISHEEHKEIFQAMLHGNQTLVIGLMRKHFTEARKVVIGQKNS